MSEPSSDSSSCLATWKERGIEAERKRRGSREGERARGREGERVRTVDRLTLGNNEAVSSSDRSNVHERKDRVGLKQLHPEEYQFIISTRQG